MPLHRQGKMRLRNQRSMTGQIDQSQVILEPTKYLVCQVGVEPTRLVIN